MSTPANIAYEARSTAVAEISLGRKFLWCLRRELWEHRLIVGAPVVAAVVYLFFYLVHLMTVRYRMHGVWPTAPEQQHDLLMTPYDFAAGLVMGTAFILGLYYCLDALYGERRDRSILFWKSMPVSDGITVLSKLTIPFAILPMLSFVITIATQLLMLLLSSVVLLGSGLSLVMLRSHSSIFHDAATMFYHIVTVHGLWYAPFYGWLLFVSAWAPRAPLVWAFLPPFLTGGFEMAIFNSNHFFSLLLRRLAGPETPMSAHAKNVMETMAALGPLEFLSLPGLWIGLAIAAAFLFAAVRLRRSRGPV
jgi:ABC-2 type transport system permease protein